MVSLLLFIFFCAKLSILHFILSKGENCYDTKLAAFWVNVLTFLNSIKINVYASLTSPSSFVTWHHVCYQLNDQNFPKLTPLSPTLPVEEAAIDRIK